MSQIKWTYELLVKFFAERGHTLLSTEYTNAKAKYDYQCKCGNSQCSITIVNLKAGKNNCKPCALRKYKATNLKKYNSEHPMQNASVRENHKSSCFKNLGVEHPMQNAKVKEKSKATNVKKLGVEYPAQNEEVKEKAKATNLKIYDCENPAQNEGVKEKMKATNVKIYGFEYPMQNAAVREKHKETCLENLGVEYTFQNEKIKEKSKETCLKIYRFESQSEEVKEKTKVTNVNKFGVENPFQNATVKEKIKSTNAKTYGFDHAMQNAEVLKRQQAKMHETNLQTYGFKYAMQNAKVLERHQKAAFKRKLYSFPSGEEKYMQGYEPFAINLLLEQDVSEEDLLLGFATMPQIMYKHNENTHRYFPDIFIPSQNKIVEVKSDYTYEASREITHLKMQACRAVGLEAEIWIFSRKGILLHVIDDFALIDTNTSHIFEIQQVELKFCDVQ